MRLKTGQLIRYRMFNNGRQYFAKVVDVGRMETNAGVVEIVNLEGIGLPKKSQFPIENLKDVKFYNSMDELEKDMPRNRHARLQAVLNRDLVTI